MRPTHTYCLQVVAFIELTYGQLLRHIPAALSGITRQSHVIQVRQADIDALSLTVATPARDALVTVQRREASLHLQCTCDSDTGLLCEFQLQALLQLLENPGLRIFFDADYRSAAIRKAGVAYGLREADDPAALFTVVFEEGQPAIRPVIPGFIPVSPEHLHDLSSRLLVTAAPAEAASLPVEKVLIWTQNRFQDQFQVELAEAGIGRNGKLRPPLQLLNPIDALLLQDAAELLKFYGALTRFQNVHRKPSPEKDLEALQWLVKNPGQLPSYLAPAGNSDPLSPAALRPVKLALKSLQLELIVHRQEALYQVTGKLTIDGKAFNLLETSVVFTYFLLAGNTLHLMTEAGFSPLLHYLQKHRNHLVIHPTGFDAFRKEILDRLGNSTPVRYTFLKPATGRQRAAMGFDAPPRPLIYLDAAGEYIHLTPVMRYGSVEIPVLSSRVIYATDPQGNPFAVPRNESVEIQLASMVILAHPEFQEQPGKDFFYLHRTRFLDDNWFLDAFESWREQGIEIKGFDRIGSVKHNSYKVKVSVSVISGQDWFNTKIDVRFGPEVVPLRKLFRAVKNKTRYIPLDDGTIGLLPEEWLEKFARYLTIGELNRDHLRTARIHFREMETVYDHRYLAPSVRDDIARLSDTLSAFNGIRPVALPDGLRGTLREYQQEGLNWLNCLDELNFGACLADDMGLGKTLQIIAFLLIQRAKHPGTTNLIIAPASLLFNWQEELHKFAPSLSVFCYYGADRYLRPEAFTSYDVILTTYTTVISECNRLKQFPFNYIVLDESQNIKNPDSQRNKAVCALHSRNKIMLTGTPVENNTFDLYGQFSFACPGLLGSRNYFKDHFFIPIDKFKDAARAEELRRRIHPFLLRRTKQQVARQLPEKTEMILYCEMEPSQRQVYDAYAEEFRNYLNHKNDGDLAREQMHILQGLTKLRQLCNSPALLNDAEYYGSSSAKLTVLLEHIETLAPTHKLLIFSQFVGMLNLIRTALEERKIRFCYLTGQTRNRGEVVSRFQEDPEERVFLISLKAGGTGLNLTAADYVFLVDPWWNPAVENQAIDRSHRIGQQQPVVAVRMICPGTIEEKILTLQSAKKELTDGLILAEKNLVKSLTKDDLLGLLT